MSAHTPGPWKTKWYPNASTWDISNKSRTICDVCPDPEGPDEKTFPQAEADARLITAAPELLAACEAVMGAVGEDEERFERALDEVRAAIAMARGA